MDVCLSALPAGRKVQVLVEMGHRNARTGARDLAAALDVANAAPEPVDATKAASER